MQTFQEWVDAADEEDLSGMLDQLVGVYVAFAMASEMREACLALARGLGDEYTFSTDDSTWRESGRYSVRRVPAPDEQLVPFARVLEIVEERAGMWKDPIPHTPTVFPQIALNEAEAILRRLREEFEQE